MKQSLKDEYRSSLKSMDTEEHIDLWFYRPLGFLWAKFFAWLGVTPNWVTIASIFLGVAGGILFYFGQPELRWLNYVGILLIIWANSYDSADGQLARMTQQYSRLGRILDGLSGDFWFAAISFAIVFRELHFGDALLGDFFSHHAWMIWTLGILSGLSHAKQAASADYYRQFHLYFLKGKEGSELDSTEPLRRAYKQMKWSDGFWKKLTAGGYLAYTAQQEQITPAMQRLRKALKEKYGDDVPQEFRDYFRAQSLPLMKYTNMLSFNTRTIVIFITVAMNVPWISFAFEVVVLNLMLVYMVLRHEHICRKALKKLNA
ncbi:MAG: CDP-alcohol phosphatidyltransferase family protein [Muribaculaceae bacterium]|nr:CDP-alcohol phosphatidyltransferase family protein [Muribaculaceae bacterium]MBQ1798745.1 CDP-alcohol phosphatidyltransferase family protein [Muribaculaceae bacterium]MBQ2483786.1 CDP-alcohol phosphatidyltransferase family protein [Muribaculaceae bacterium]MBQ4006272.1 CDP-alcohol phosphatidyltransferase family protein [Muribaculaceae bacterium]